MPNINISVKDKIAVQTDRTRYICGNSDFTAVFDFDSEWDAFETKTARFRYNGKHAEVIFTGNECEVPVITDTNDFEIGVYAGNLHTTTPALVLCEKSILCGSGLPADPTPDIYEQLVKMLDSKADKDAWKYVGKVSVASDDEATEMVIDKDIAGNAFALRRFRIRGTVRSNQYSNIDRVLLFVNHGENDSWVSSGGVVTGTKSNMYGMSFDLTAENICGTLGIQTYLSSSSGSTEETSKSLRNATTSLGSVGGSSEFPITSIRSIRLSTEVGNKVICGGGSWVELYGIRE